MKKVSFRDRRLPSSLEGLPRYGFKAANTSSRAEHERTDFAYGVRSIDDLWEKMKAGFADPKQPASSSRTPLRRRPKY